ncbi:MAG: hypothetical protein PHN56_06975 [Candidatus Nanoarchaeia archaeon]|nr:hypothetical protein [Candidatus Nanoarchaeia archaeon]
MATEKKPAKTEEKKQESNEEKELQEKYTKVFKKVVDVVQSEENVAIVYQVLVDILTQLEQHIKQEMGSGCEHDCSGCNECGPAPKKK